MNDRPESKPRTATSTVPAVDPTSNKPPLKEGALKEGAPKEGAPMGAVAVDPVEYLLAWRDGQGNMRCSDAPIAPSDLQDEIRALVTCGNTAVTVWKNTVVEVTIISHAQISGLPSS